MNHRTPAATAVLLLFTLPLSAAEPAFCRGVNIGGSPVTIDGRRWDGDDAKYLVCTDRKLVLKKRLALKPAADDARAALLHAFRWSRRARVRLTGVPGGTYTLWVYIVEDNNPETFDIFVEGMPALRGVNSGPQGTWQKAGPIVAAIEDGAIDIATRGGAANLCGIEVWKGGVKGVEPLSPPRAPVSPFLGTFADRKPRFVVMTDIGGDPDDRQSLVRYLLYTCDFETEGFCTGFGWGHRKNTRPDLIRKAIGAYAKVADNLRAHRKDYPAAVDLLKLVKDGHNGDPHAVGPGMDSAASGHIIAVLEADDPRPVWFGIWGGPRELAQALWKMQQTRGADELARLKAKIRIHSIADQDRTAEWIKTHHPDVFYLYSEKLFRGIWKYGDQEIVSPAWVGKHIAGHGPLGDPDVYPPAAAGKKGVKEGDTPSFFWVLRNGLGDPEAPGWGNWGGRFRYRGEGSAFVPAEDRREDGQPDRYYTIWRWRTAYQNAFQARMDWCVKPFEEANHPPIAVCNGAGGVGTVRVGARPGGTVALSARGSSDPDGNRLGYRWWVYREAGTFEGDAAVDRATAARASLAVPGGAGGTTIHVILEVTDDGRPPLTAYRRVVVTVQ